MPDDQRTPNGATSTGNSQGDGDNRSVKEAPPDTQKALDAAAAEPRNVPGNGHAGENPEQERRG
jgi:hypothetical protein